jgi:D-alanyl-D-alanine carboxypeptidase (penicillin-binding protein 5/6)
VIAAIAISLALAVPGLSDAASIKPLRLPMPPIKSFPAPPPPLLDATAWMIWAEREDAELGSLNPDEPRAFASITKVMTGIVAVENSNLEEPVAISPEAASTPIGYDGQPDVRGGEDWILRDLLTFTLVGSGNRASAALAEGVSGTAETFVEEMNAKAIELDMPSTSFTNPHGLDATGHISTARDLITMGMYALGSEDLKHIVRIKGITWNRENRVVGVTSTNRLLGLFPGYAGIKTGDTAAAGQTLLAYVDTGPSGLVAVILGSSGRRLATRELLAWGMSALGPRDRFYSAAAGTELAGAFPDWYQTRMDAPQPLDPGPRDPSEPTPLTKALNDGYLDLLPAILGGDE